MNHIEIYTDGACSGNPGPAGIGIVLIYGNIQRHISQYIGEGTNNIAELSAIQVALQHITQKTIPIVIYTDSQYAQGVLTKEWKAKSNAFLINQIKQQMLQFSNITILHVRGHSGHPLNETANDLAVLAVKTRKNTTKDIS